MDFCPTEAVPDFLGEGWEYYKERKPTDLEGVVVAGAAAKFYRWVDPVGRVLSLGWFTLDGQTTHCAWGYADEEHCRRNAVRLPGEVWSVPREGCPVITGLENGFSIIDKAGVAHTFISSLTHMYICPMHPEIRQEKPGSCQKCGMALVVEGMATSVVEKNSVGGSTGLKAYMPLMVTIGIILLASVIGADPLGPIGFIPLVFVNNFMAGFFLVFAGFKLLDLPGFVQGYSTYDLLAKRLPAYGYLFPFLELTLGLLMVKGLHEPIYLWAEVVVMLFSGLGVAIKMWRKERIQCACMGTVLKVPLSSVTLVENFGMAALGLVMLWWLR